MSEDDGLKAMGQVIQIDEAWIRIISVSDGSGNG